MFPNKKYWEIVTVPLERKEKRTFGRSSVNKDLTKSCQIDSQKVVDLTQI